ncbi:WD domain, G-beta repeat protein [Dictyocaulus viviparus]|uniref:WD domain, G-beta repeat protein n=1 Tax=Dictyocaulus viviparus TaxID=29172 RepID=A0A0D8XVC6_DICVI|nr:WD domain, G-beta repeat protein [Dictyocaulus viviparus]
MRNDVVSRKSCQKCYLVMMLHNHLLGPSSTLTSTSGLQTVAALYEGSLLNNTSNQPKEELKTHFTAREGTYKLMTMAEYSRPNRIPVNQMQPGTGNVVGAPVRVSFLSLVNGKNSVSPKVEEYALDMEENCCDDLSTSDRICFNVGRELYVYLYKGTHTAADLSKPIDKRVYKGTYPTCHHFNQETATSTSCSLIIGFSAGQIQLIDPLHKEYQSSRLYNEERFIDKTSVTCLRWVPGQRHHFLVSYTSGYMYLYNEELQCPLAPPVYQAFKQGDKYTVYMCKAKTTRNPVYRWQVGEGSINQFAFSGPDAKMLATVGHDGYLRIFNYHQMELLAYMKSYFGGLLTLAWSPDSKLIVTGGEDDLLTVYNINEKRVVCRGLGHKSWISQYINRQVQFDPYMCTVDGDNEINGLGALEVGSDDEKSHNYGGGLQNGQNGSANTSGIKANMRKPQLQDSSYSRCSFASFGTNGTSHGSSGICYRIGSVGHDTQLCLWDITEDMLKPANVQRHRNSTIIAPMLGLEVQTSSSRLDPLCEASSAQSAESSKPKKKKGFYKRGFNLGRLGGSSSDRRRIDSPATNASSALDEAKLLGTRVCPRMEDIPVIEPLICKKIAHERLTVLEFRRDCLVTACQEGFICTWARPGMAPTNLVKRDVNSPSVVSSPTGFRDGIALEAWGNVASAQALG